MLTLHRETTVDASHPPVGGVHEAALYVHDLDRAQRFWGDRLGFPLVVREEGRHAFHRVGRDMLLLFNAEASARSDRIPAHGASGPGHVAFDVPDAAALDAWRRRLEELGIEIEHRQQWPSGGRSIYFRDPDGNSIEFITRGTWGA